MRLENRNPDNLIFSCAEESHSGLVHHLGKMAYLNGYREFESRLLRTEENHCREKDGIPAYRHTLTGIVSSNLATIIYSTLTKIEGGVVTKPGVQTIQKVAKSLGVSIGELLK